MNRFIRYYHTKRKPSYEGYWDRILEKANGVPVTQSTKKPIPIPFYTEPPTSSSPPKVGKSVLFKGKIMPFPEKPAEPDNCCMSGCVHCVWDLYQEDMEEYVEKKKQLRELFIQAGEPLPAELDSKSAKEETIDMDPTMKAFLEMEKKLKK